MQNENETIRALMLSIVDNQTLLAEAITHLANEALNGEVVRNLATGVNENNEVISKALHELGSTSH